jgi:hypothetical protein
MRIRNTRIKKSFKANKNWSEQKETAFQLTDVLSTKIEAKKTVESPEKEEEWVFI